MVGHRSRYGLFVSALGATVLATSVFLPWYQESFTARASPAALAHRSFAAVSGHQALGGSSIVLLALAGLAMLDALLPLARTRAPVPAGAGGSVVLLGAVAAVYVLFRIVDPPTPAGGLIALSPRQGAWLALLGSLTMVLGDLWPRRPPYPEIPHARVSAWPALSGRTPPGLGG